MKKSFLAFDLGASSGRAIVGDLAEGRLTLTEVHRFANGPLRVGEAFHWDYPALVRELKTGLGKALKFAPELSGIAIDTWGVDYALFRRGNGELIRLPYHYRDERTERAVPGVHKLISQHELYRRTGIQFMSLNTIYQLYAHNAEHPEDFQNAMLLPMPDALAFALGAEPTAEYTEASTSNLLNPETRDWDWELIDRLGLPRDLFPRIVKPGTLGGVLTRELQSEFGCGPIPLIKVGSHDTASAVAAVPAPEQGDWAYLSCGTWALLGAERPQPLRSAESEAGPFTNEGGVENTIRFLTNIMGSWLFQETRRTWRESGREISFSEMEQLARDAEPCRYLVNPNAPEFLPPGDMPQRIRDYCARTGQGGKLDDAAVVRAIYDSLALYFAAKIQELGKILDADYRSLNIVGGGVKDGLLMELTADAAELTVVAGPVEATATGNLLMQAIALKQLPDLATARRVVRDSFAVREYQPRAEMSERYRRESERFRKLLAVR